MTHSELLLPVVYIDLNGRPYHVADTLECEAGLAVVPELKLLGQLGIHLRNDVNSATMGTNKR